MPEGCISDEAKLSGRSVWAVPGKFHAPGVGCPNVSAANDEGLFLYQGAVHADTTIRLVLREGDLFDPEGPEGNPGKLSAQCSVPE